MFIAANLVEALAYVLNIFLTVYLWIIIIRAVISWVNPNPWNPIVQFLYRSTEPVLQPIRRLLPIGGGIDFSPLVAILGIYFLQRFLVASLYDLARSLR
ncbi:MAG: YggT family protein [candidate division NC10 bacterium]|nr:YggT family protein [candidate division NC10 bacterium]